MADIDWDDDEDITRDRRWPPGMSFRNLTQPQIRIMGPPALGFVPGAGALGRAKRDESGRRRSRRALPLPGSAKGRGLRCRSHRPENFSGPDTDRLAGQLPQGRSDGSTGGSEAAARLAPALAAHRPEPTTHLGFEELYDVFDLTDDDDTEAMRRAIAVAVVDATRAAADLGEPEDEPGVGPSVRRDAATPTHTPEPYERDVDEPMGFEPVSLDPVRIEPDEPVAAAGGGSFSLEPMGFEPVWDAPGGVETLEEDVQEQRPEPNESSAEVIELQSSDVESVVDEAIELPAVEGESPDGDSVQIDLAELEDDDGDGAGDAESDEAIELPPNQLVSERLDVGDLDWEDLETVKLAPEVVARALESVAQGLSQPADAAAPQAEAKPATNPFLTESSTSFAWPPPSLAEAMEAEPETVPCIDSATRRGATDDVEEAAVEADPPSAEDAGPALPRKTPVLEMVGAGPPSVPEAPPDSGDRLIEPARASLPEAPSRPGAIVPVDELDEAPPVALAAPTMEQLAQAADAAAVPSPPRKPAAPPDASPPPPSVRRKQHTTAAWPPPLPVPQLEPAPAPRTGRTLAGLCPKAEVPREPPIATQDVPPPTAKVTDSEPPPAPESEDRAATPPPAPPEPSVILNRAVAPVDEPREPVAAGEVDRGLVGLRPVAVEVRADTRVVEPRAAADESADAPSQRVQSNITRERRRVDREEEERHRQALGYESTMPYSWVTVPALESSPALPLVERPSAASLSPTAVPELPPLRHSGLRAAAQWLAVAATVVAMALITWQLLPREGSLRVSLAAPVSAAAVYVDGAKKCDVVPCEVADLRPGARVITVLAPGFERSQTVASVLAGERIEVTLPMEALPPPPEPTVQGLRATSQQRGVEIFVDGKRRGELPIELNDLEPGQHTVLFSAGDRYADLEQVVDVGVDSIEDLGNIELTLLRGVLTLEVRTPHSRVLLGTKGKRSSQKDVRGPWPKQIELEPGHYDVIGAKEGCLPVAYSVAVDAKHPEPHVVIDLEPDPSYYLPY